MSIFYVTMNCVDIAVMQDNSIQMKRDIQSFIYNLRLSAEVQVIEMVCKHLCSSFLCYFWILTNFALHVGSDHL